MEVKMASLSEPAFKKIKQEQEEPEESGVKWNDLPELPFEKILSYLSLADRIKTRAVSKKWRMMVDNSRVKNLCYSKSPIGCLLGKFRWASGAFAQNYINFINSARFTSFFQTFGQSIFSNLKHLRLCEFKVNEENQPAFAQALNSFNRLEELDLIRFEYPYLNLELNLPMLNSIQLKDVFGIKKLTLDAPKLQNVDVWKCSSFLNLGLVHVESVERLIIDDTNSINVKNLKNLKFLIIGKHFQIDLTLLSGLAQLKKIHLQFDNNVSKLFEQKQQYGRADLKIYFNGLLLNGQDDPAFNSLRHYNDQTLAYLAENGSRLAAEIPFEECFFYKQIQSVHRRSEVSLLKRFINLDRIIVSRRVQDIERFLDILKNLDNIVDLEFRCDQPQDLLDKLPDCCTVQQLSIGYRPADFRFICRLRHLIKLHTNCEIDNEFIREAFKELKFLSKIEFKRLVYNWVTITKITNSGRKFGVSIKKISYTYSDTESEDEDKDWEIGFSKLKPAIRFIDRFVTEEDEEEEKSEEE